VPERLARERGGTREGLAWLGRTPETRASLLVRILALVARVAFFVVLRFRIRCEGREHLPAGPCIVVAAAHRGWMDPFLVMHALPLEPRVWFLGSGPSAFDRRWKERLIHRLGGMLPVWRGGVGIEQHVAAADAVLRAGGVLATMPEGGIAGPVGRIAAFRIGSALIALRTGATIVPIALAGSEELYLGRRLATRILPATSARQLLGDAWDGTLPEPGSRAELALAGRLTDLLRDELGPAVEAIHPWTVDPPSRPRRLRGLTWLLLSRGSRGAGSGSRPTAPAPIAPGATDPGPAAPGSSDRETTGPAGT
jgi:1-acyl-sn-glycerol-3-phosphate acyltransferase